MKWLRCMLLLTAACTVNVHAATAPATSAPAAARATTNVLTVRDAWARATAPGMTVGAAYLTLQGGDAADQLVAASTARAATTQIHVVTESAGMSRMRETEAVDIPAGRRVLLAPQGTHLMLMGLTQPLVAGERFQLTLTFAQAGRREISVLVVAPGAEPPPSR